MGTSQPAAARTYGREPSRLDPVAPDWIVRILAPKPAPVPWADVARSALTVAAPLALGLALGQGGLGLFGGMGALVGAFGDNGGSFRARLRRVLVGAGGGLLGLLCGRLIAQEGGPGAVLAVAALAVVSALASSVSANLSFGGLQLLVYVAVAGALPPTVGLPLVVAAFAVGLTWAIVLSFVQTRLQPQVNEPDAAETEVLDALATLLAAPPAEAASPTSHDRRVALTRELAQAYDDVVTARAVSAGRRGDLRRLAAVVTATFTLVDAAFAHLDAGGARGAELGALVSRLAVLVGRRRDRQTRRLLAAFEDDLRGAVPGDPDAAPVLAAMVHVVRSLGGRGSDAAPGTDRPGWTSLLLGGRAWTFAARLGITMAVAEAVREVVGLEKPYWIVLTAALVLKPDLGSVFARGVQRTLGTFVGVLIGVAVLALVPSGPWLLIPVAVFAGAFQIGKARNYGLLSTFITPLVLLLVDFGTRVTAQVALDRLADTALGAGIVLVVGYLCWPGTWAPRVGEHVAVGVEVLGTYARVAFEPDRAPVGAARRRTYRAMSDIRAELASTLAEPPPISRQAAAWWPMVAQLEKTSDDLSDAAFRARHAAARPPHADVQQLVAAFDDLAAAMRGHRSPRDLPDPVSPLLADLAGDLRGARSIARGPLHG